jgi:hypothetical protein
MRACILTRKIRAKRQVCEAALFSNKKSTSGHIEVVSRKPVPILEEVVAQITEENRHEEIDGGQAVGREIVSR